MMGETITSQLNLRLGATLSFVSLCYLHDSYTTKIQKKYLKQIFTKSEYEID